MKNEMIASTIKNLPYKQYFTYIFYYVEYISLGNQYISLWRQTSVNSSTHPSFNGKNGQAL